MMIVGTDLIRCHTKPILVFYGPRISPLLLLIKHINWCSVAIDLTIVVTTLY
jgi:hypothetical protein